MELLARANAVTRDELTGRLARAESAGILALEGNRVRFTHRLLASGVYTAAAPAARRAMHRTLAALETLPELTARHLALSSATGNEEIFAALDSAADSAHARGAPAAAAELLDLAIGLGGDDPVRRLRSADNHFLAGNTARAAEVLGRVETMEPGVLRATASSLLATVLMYRNEHHRAVELLRSAADDAAGNVAVLVQVLLRLSFALNSIGELDDARRCARDAVKLAEELSVSAVTSAALPWWSRSTSNGARPGEKALWRALQLYDSTFDVPIIFRAPFVHALTLSWTGHLEQAHRELTAARRLCVERGAESDMMAIAGFLAINHLWRGQLPEAAAEVAEPSNAPNSSAVRRPDHPDDRAGRRGRLRRSRGRRSRRCALGARRDQEPQHVPRRRLAGDDAVFPRGVAGPAPRGVAGAEHRVPGRRASAGDRADVRLAPARRHRGHGGVGRFDEAAALTGELERNGVEHDRAWMKAVGARCRAMLVAAGGDTRGAERIAHRAMAEHDRLPMPFERARTQLVLVGCSAGYARSRRRQRI